MLRLKVKDTIHLHLSYWFQHGFRKFHSGETLKNLLQMRNTPQESMS